MCHFVVVVEQDPLSGSDWTSSSVHELMNTEELAHLFGVQRSSLVNRTEYQVTYITTYRSKSSSSSSSVAAAAGDQIKPDSEAVQDNENGEIRFEFSAFGR